MEQVVPPLEMEQVDRVRTYVKNLDERMDGGIPSSYVVLISGKAGSMKSSLAYYILYNAARMDGKRSLYVSLEQGRPSLLRQMTKLGMPHFDQVVIQDIGDIVVVDMAKLRKEMLEHNPSKDVNWMKSIITTIKSYDDKFGCDIFVLDSLAAMYTLVNFQNPRNELFWFFEQLRDLDITTLLISETPANSQTFGPYGVEDFLADGIIHLDTQKDDRKVNLFLSVVKMRETKHDRGYYPLILDESGFEIVTD